MVEKHVPTEKDFTRLPIVGDQPKDEKEELFLREICEFEFYNLEDTGLSIKFPYGSTNIRQNFQFFHGGKYRVPRHVARHIETRVTPRYQWTPDGSGKMVGQRVGDKPRFQMRQVYGS